MQSSLLPLLQPDHLSVRVNDAEQVHRLFAEVFALPVAWPLQSLTFAKFSWVSVGNTNIEFWQSSSNADLPLDGKPLAPFVHGMAVDCDHTEQTVTALAEIGFACTPAKTFGSTDSEGRQVNACTKSQLLDVSGPKCQVFLCHWHREGLIFPWKENLSAAERRQGEKRALAAVAGGTLGIQGLAEIQMSVPDAVSAALGWDRISRRMSATGEYRWDLGDGIVLSMHEGEEHMMTSLLFRVRSLEQAKRALAERGLLGEHTMDAVAILPKAVAGLDFRLIQ